MKTCIVLLVLVAVACDSIPVEPLEDNEWLGVLKYRKEPVYIIVPENAKVDESVANSGASAR